MSNQEEPVPNQEEKLIANQEEKPVANQEKLILPVSKEARAPNKQKKILVRLTIFFVIIALLYFIYWFFYSRYFEETDNAYVGGNVVPVTSQVSGNIIAVEVDDTMFVKKGALLVKLDPTDSIIALEQAKATLALTLRQTNQIFINDRGLKATVQARQTSLRQTDIDLKRRQRAIGIGGVSKEDLTHAQDNFTIADSSLIQAQSQWQANRALIANITLTQHPAVRQAIANLRQAFLSFKRNTIYAPVAGFISKRSAQVGQRIAPGSLLMAIVPLDEVWVDANFKEKQLREVRAGQSAVLTADIYGSALEYQGRVVGFAGGTGSAFALLPAQNATGNWIKVVQRLPVRIALDAKQLKEHPLRIGLSMDVTIDTRTGKQGKTLQNIPYSPSYKTNIFDNVGKEADALIARIIRENVVNEHDNLGLNKESNGH